MDAKILDKIEIEIERIQREKSVTIKGIWAVDCLYHPSLEERIFDFKFIVVKTLGQGSSYSIKSDYSKDDLKKYMTKELKDISVEDLALKVAIYDSVYDKFQRKDYREVTLKGDSSIKANKRAEIIVSEIDTLLKGQKQKRIVNVGVVSTICKKLISKGYKVCGTDYDESIIGEGGVCDFDIYHGERTLEEVANSDLALVTGMTLSTNTIDDIIRVAKRNDTKIVVFAETASNLGDFFLDAGVDTFISEPFPFYIYDGVTSIRIKRRNEYYEQESGIFVPRMQN